VGSNSAGSEEFSCLAAKCKIKMNNIAALSKAISLTDEILTVLDDRDFTAISELDDQRQPLIEMAFSESIEQIDVIKAQHLQNLNQQVVDKLNLLKESVLHQQRQNKHAIKATRAYQNV
jgi:hypothetical protein